MSTQKANPYRRTAKVNRRVTLTKDAFIHLVQGSHYTSPTFQKLLFDMLIIVLTLY